MGRIKLLVGTPDGVLHGNLSVHSRFGVGSLPLAKLNAPRASGYTGQGLSFEEKLGLRDSSLRVGLWREHKRRQITRRPPLRPGAPAPSG